MIITNCKILLFDVSTEQDDTTGERTKHIVSESNILGQQGEVGLQTYWSATANNIKLNCVFTIRRRAYKNQKYAFANNNLYEIKNTAKAKSPDLVQLNATLLKEDTTKEMVFSDLGIVQES